MISFIHTGKILPRTFARTIETLQPLKDAAIPCIAPFPRQYGRYGALPYIGDVRF